MLFVKADKAMEKLGFEKIKENEFGASYRKKSRSISFLKGWISGIKRTEIISSSLTLRERILMDLITV